MRKILRAAALMIGITVAAAASPVMAQVLPYSLANTDPTLPTYHFDSGQPCSIHTTGGPYYYRLVTATVSTAGVYTFVDNFTPGDASLGVYSGAFNATTPATNCVATVDDNQNVTLSAGTYTFVLTSLGTALTSTYQYTITGPAAVVIAPAASVPTMSEWAMILFGLLLVGGAAVMIQRRRLA